MAEDLSQRLGGLSSLSSQEATDLRKALEAIIDGIQAVNAILDADSGVTATTCASTFAGYITK